MRLEVALIGAVFVVGGVCGASPDGVLAQIHRRHANAHDQLRRDADAALHNNAKRTLSTADVFGRPGGVWPTVTVPTGYTLAAGVELTPVPGQPTVSLAAVATGGAALLANGSIDNADWDAEAETACLNAMDALDGNAGNPTGLVVCYNIPYLNTQNGTFEAELRIFNVSQPTGDWVGVTAAQMMVTLQYAGATISPTDSGDAPVKRALKILQPFLRKRQATSTSTSTSASSGATTTPSEVATRTYIGEINSNLFTPGMNVSAMEPLLIPQISIEATDSAGQTINATLSSTQASFVAGVFSNSSSLTTDPKSILGNPAAEIVAAQEGAPTPYVVPGLALGVKPIGLVVTSIWTALFFATVGLGIIGRIQYRDQYRKQMKAQSSESVRRI